MDCSLDMLVDRLSVCLSVCLPVCLSVCLSVWLPACLSAWLSTCLASYLTGPLHSFGGTTHPWRHIYNNGWWDTIDIPEHSIGTVGFYEEIKDKQTKNFSIKKTTSLPLKYFVLVIELEFALAPIIKNLLENICDHATTTRGIMISVQQRQGQRPKNLFAKWGLEIHR